MRKARKTKSINRPKYLIFKKPCGVLCQFTDGSGRPTVLNAGEIIILPANKPYALKALKRFKMMLVMIKAK